MTPIYQTSTFAFRGVNRPGAFEYSRSGNPTRKALETCLASLEGGAFGFAFATGMAAETTVVMMLEAGNRIIVHSDLYGGTFRLFEKVFRNKGIEAVTWTFATWPKRSANWRAAPLPYGSNRRPTR